jgi:hypothetical protein
MGAIRHVSESAALYTPGNARADLLYCCQSYDQLARFYTAHHQCLERSQLRTYAAMATPRRSLGPPTCWSEDAAQRARRTSLLPLGRDRRRHHRGTCAGAGDQRSDCREARCPLVPGMPIGSPGMEGGTPEVYDVILFGKHSPVSFGRFMRTPETNPMMATPITP